MTTTGIYVKEGNGIVEKQIPTEEAVEIYKSNPLDFYSSFFYGKTKKSMVWQKAVGKKIAEKYQFESVLDIGCAAGYYLEGMIEGGVQNVLGFEYSYENVKEFVSDSMKDFVKYGNAMENIDAGQFDCCMSIEVAEHLLPEKTDMFLDNITSAAKDMIIFTAAPPGQKGTGHINEQTRDWWIDKIRERGFILSKEDIQTVHNCFSETKHNCKYMSFIKAQIMCFRKGVS